MDDRIRLATYRAIYGNGVRSQYSLRAVPPIHIVVNNGHVTLEGVVARQMDKQVASRVLRNQQSDGGRRGEVPLCVSGCRTR
jgi:osmotically-inducible protein OsmY